MATMKILEKSILRKVCPVKWHANIPEDGISLGVADVDFEGPPNLMDYIKENLDNNFVFYQRQTGLKETINHISDFLDSKAIIHNPSNIQVIPGTMMGIYASMKWASRRDGDVLCVGPIYEPIHRHATDTGNKVIWSSITGLGVDIDQLTEKISNNTKLLVICNPNNPNGYIYSKAELITIRDLCVDNDVLLFADELYEPLVFDKTHYSAGSIEGLSERSILLYGFSKAYGLAGLRSGFMVLGDQINDEVQKIVEAQLVSPSPFASIVCSYALTHPDSQTWKENFRKQMKINTELAWQQFTEQGFDCYKPNGTFFVFPNLKVDDVKFTENLLQHHGVQVVEGSKFGPMGKKHVRINCATSEARLAEALNRIQNELERSNY